MVAFPDPFDGLSSGARVKKLHEDARQSFAQVHQAMDEERAFVFDLEQFKNDRGNTRDLTRVQPRDQSPFRLARFVASSMLKSPPYFKARPIDEQTDPKTAHYAKWGIEFELTNPQNRIDRVIRDVVWSGLTSRMGVAAADWNADAGVFGDIRYRFVDPKNVMWAPGFNDPHDPECPWLMETSRMSLEAIKRMRGWKNAADVRPDDEHGGRRSDPDQNYAGVMSKSNSTKAPMEPMKTQPAATIAKLWERFSGDKKKRKGTRVLTDEQRYMAIAAGEHEGKRVHVDYGTEPLPALDILPQGHTIEGPEGQPVDVGGMPIRRIEEQLTEEERLAYPNGKLTIVAVNSTGEGGPVVLYEGPWPQPMRSFPYLVWQPYVNPFKQVGTSDVDLNWTMTLVKNGTIRRWYEQLHEARGIVLLPEVGLSDAYGEPFMYTDANGVQAFYGKGFPPSGVQVIAGPQPSPSLQAFYQVVDANLRTNEGTGDVSSSGDAQQLKGVAVGAIERAVATGNISVDDHIASWQIEFGLFLSIIHDIQRARWTVERFVRYLGAQGRDAWMRLRGEDIPACDIIISARPTLDQFATEKLSGLKDFAAMAQQSPAVAKIAAKYMNIDPDDMAEILKGMQPPPMVPPAGGAPGGMMASAPQGAAAPGMSPVQM